MVGHALVELLGLLGILLQLVVGVFLHIQEVAVLVVVFEKAVFLVVEVGAFHPEIAVVPEVFPAALLVAELVGAVDAFGAVADAVVVLGDGDDKSALVKFLGHTVGLAVDIRHCALQPAAVVEGAHRPDDGVGPPQGDGVVLVAVLDLLALLFAGFVVQRHIPLALLVEGPEAVEEQVLAVAFGEEVALFVIGAPPAVGLAVHQGALARLGAGRVVEGDETVGHSTVLGLRENEAAQ